MNSWLTSLFARGAGRRISIIAVVLLLLIFFIGSSMLIKRNSAIRKTSSVPSTPVAAETPSTPIPGQEGFALSEFHRSEVRDGKVIWEIYGKSGHYVPGENIAKVDEPKLTLSRPDGKNIHLTAKQATLHMNGAELAKAEVEKDIVLTYGEETTVNADHAIYNKEDDLVTANGNIVITNSLVRTTGNSLTANLKTQEIKITDGVRSLVNKEEKQQ